MQTLCGGLRLLSLKGLASSASMMEQFSQGHTFRRQQLLRRWPPRHSNEHLFEMLSGKSLFAEYVYLILTAFRVIIVVVDFEDVKCPPGTIERTQDLWFSRGKIPTGSVSEYYSEVSNNAISLTGDVVGPFTLKKDMAYYANDRRIWHDHLH